MENIEQFIRMLTYEKELLRRSIDELENGQVQREIQKKNIVIKKIRGRLYYYEQWHSEGKLHSRSLGVVKPGRIAEIESRYLNERLMEEKLEEKKLLLANIESALEQAEKKRPQKKLVDRYTFEVYWKDEITARVYVHEREAIVSRFVEHPVKQLFAADRMTRNQLNRILELRCWERGRADIQELLNRIGLSEYNPQQIVRRTHGVSYNDYIWFRFPGERLTSRDVLVRA